MRLLPIFCGRLRSGTLRITSTSGLFYHPTSRRVFPSQDVTFDESVPFYCLFPYYFAPPPPPLLFLAPGPLSVDPLPHQGPAPSRVSQTDPLPSTAPVEVAVGAGAARGAASRGAEPGGAESEGAGDAESEGAESGGAEPRGTASSRGPAVIARAGGTGSVAAAGPGGARTSGTGATRTSGVGGVGAGDPTKPGGAGAGGAGAVGAGAGGTGAGGAGAGRAGAVDPRAGGTGGTVRLRPCFSQPPLQPAFPLPAPSPYTEQTGGLIERREPASRPASPVRTGRRVPRPRPPPVPGTHAMALRSSSVPLCVPLPPPPESSLPAVPDPDSDRDRAASPTVSRLLATVVSDLSFESTAASALVAELVDFAAACRLDYTTALVVDSGSSIPPSVGGECALGTDVLEDRQEDFECLAAALVYGLRHAPCDWHDTLKTTLEALGFTPSTADPSLFLCTETSLPPFYVLVCVDNLVSASADTKAQALVLQCFGFQFSSPQPTPLCTNHSLSAPPSHESVEPSGLYPELVGCLMYLMTCTRPDLVYPLSLLARYVAPGRHRKGPVVLTGHADASWVDDLTTQRSSQGYTFSLGSGSVSWRSTCSSSILSSSCEAEIYVGAMAAEYLRWLTYLLTDLGEQPRSPPVLYVDNKAMIVLCREHRLEHRTKHIALRYFLARELQQRGQLRLAYMATRANTADIFTKALLPGDHQPCFDFLD
ncbi:unnamed protein product [Closterium sp. NIES-53]